jgi:uncharacterized protein YjbJ (UPF0337 family)
LYVSAPTAAGIAINLHLHPEFPESFRPVALRVRRPAAAKDARWAIPPVEGKQKEIEMNWDIAEGNWNQFRGKVKAQWGKLTDDHLDVIAGKRIELAGKIQEAYGISKDEAEKQIKQFEDSSKD